MNTSSKISNPGINIRVALADDHQLMREGLKLMLHNAPGIEVVADTENGHELLMFLRENHVDVAVVDMLMPGMPGVDLIGRIKSEFPKVAILVLTMHSDQLYAMRAFQSGAKGYLTKDSAAAELTSAIRKVSQGGSHITPSLAEKIIMGLNTFSEAPTHSKLSNREFEVFRLLVRGLRLTDIADKLHVSIKTVSTHKLRILEKMGLTSVAQLVKYSMENNVFDGNIELGKISGDALRDGQR